MTEIIICGDCRRGLLEHAPFDLVLADPPYGDTSLNWDKHCDGWIEVASKLLKPNGSMWVFGSMRFFQKFGAQFERAGFALAQDIVWEKHNGAGFAADRFKRVHELACHYYRQSSKWSDVYNEVQKTADATKRTMRRKKRPTHMGNIDAHHYASEDGGPRIMRSVIFMPSMQGRAIHPTEKPAPLLEILIRTSCPAGGNVADMFAGSGAGGEAARIAGRNYVGTEIDPAMATKAERRLCSGLPFTIPDHVSDHQS